MIEPSRWKYYKVTVKKYSDEKLEQWLANKNNTPEWQAVLEEELKSRNRVKVEFT